MSLPNVVVERLIDYWQNADQDPSMHNMCRQLADRVLGNLSAGVLASVRRDPLSQVSEIRRALDALSRTDPVTRELIQSISPTVPTTTQHVSVTGDSDQVIVVGRDIQGANIRFSPPSSPERTAGMNPMEHINILAIFANPKGTDPLRLGEEDRVMRECLRLSKGRDLLDLEVKHAATIHDMRRALLDNDYRIVHFSGHGTGQGLVLEDELGQVRLVPPEALAELLSAYSPPIECVILNACYSDVQGQMISLGVPYTIAMNSAISDRSAIEFTRGFYDAMGAGKGIEFAYQEGCRTIKLMGLADGDIPALFKKTIRAV